MYNVKLFYILYKNVYIIIYMYNYICVYIYKQVSGSSYKPQETPEMYKIPNCPF